MMEEAVEAMEEALENSEWHCMTVFNLVLGEQR